MSLGTILVIILIIFLLGGFSGRFGGYGYGYGHGWRRCHRYHPDRHRRTGSHGSDLISRSVVKLVRACGPWGLADCAQW
jgi:hypothetical protein